MMQKLLFIASFIFLTFGLMADFPEDFQKAGKAFDAHKNQEAMESFQKISVTAPTPRSKAECLSYAAKALGRDKTQYNAAIEMAMKIEIREISVITQMEIMQENRKFKEISETFKNEDFSNWADFYKLKLYSLRGNSECVIGQYDAAENDLMNAVRIAGSDAKTRIIALGTLNDVYFQRKDYENVQRTSKQIFEMKQFNGFRPYLTAVLLCSRAQAFQGKYAEAMETLKLIDHMKTGVYRCQALIVCGDIYAAQGKKDEASAKYKEASAMKGLSGIPDLYINQVQKKIETLEK